MHRIEGRRTLTALFTLIVLTTFAPTPVSAVECRIGYIKCMGSSKKPTSPIHKSELECMGDYLGCIARAIIQT